MRPDYRHRSSGPAAAQTGLARALSKLGFCSRSQAFELIRAGQVKVNGQRITNPEWRVSLSDQFTVTGQSVEPAASKIYLALNKPRGLVTTTSDEKGRTTVFSCLTPENESPQSAAGILPAVSSRPYSSATPKTDAASRPDLPRLIPVGRLDMASEGLLLFTNDTAWANHLTAPESHLDKTYHVQIDKIADDTLCQKLTHGLSLDREHLATKRVSLLRQGLKNSWLEIVLDEGKNRHIRRLLAACDIEVLRLIRIAIGPLQLGDLPKSHWRHLTSAEIKSLSK